MVIKNTIIHQKIALAIANMTTCIIAIIFTMLNIAKMKEIDMTAKKWIQKAIKHPGALKESLHVKKGEKIPESKLKKAEHSKNPKTKKRAQLAETLRKMHK